MVLEIRWAASSSLFRRTSQRTKQQIPIAFLPGLRQRTLPELRGNNIPLHLDCLYEFYPTRHFVHSRSCLFSTPKQKDSSHQESDWQGSPFAYHYVVPSPENRDENDLTDLDSNKDSSHMMATTNVVKAVQYALEDKRKQAESSTERGCGMEFVYASNVEAAARDLIRLGSVWFRPSCALTKSSQSSKPRRLSLQEAENIKMQSGDYLRIHFNPRRFPSVHDYDWNSIYVADEEEKTKTTPTQDVADKTKKPGIIVGENKSKGWLVINKPANIPVHMTVDNGVENVLSCIFRARVASGDDGDDDELYVGAPQRLDQNTSGLLVVSTSRRFTIFFTDMLRTKTRNLKIQHRTFEMNADDEYNAVPDDGEQIGDDSSGHAGIQKVYKCLVCLLPPNEYSKNATTNQWQSVQPPSENSTLTPSLQLGTSWSVGKAKQHLSSSVNQVVRHWLEPSVRAPKNYFVRAPPQPTEQENRRGAKMWQEALLRITQVGEPFPLIGNKAGRRLAKRLWGENTQNDDDGMDCLTRVPDGCQAVVEVQLELLTGRTHQIRGQLAAMGYPVVGDAQYGGSRPLPQQYTSYRVFPPKEKNSDYFKESELLALQCSQLCFVDPDETAIPDTDWEHMETRNNTKSSKIRPLVQSQRWNRFKLDQAWWTIHLSQYHDELAKEDEIDATTSIHDSGIFPYYETEIDFKQTNSKGRPRPKLLPERVQLSPGKNKYVLARAFWPPGLERPEHEPINYWFVKSASPTECGGPYHGNVAQDLREWIEGCGFEVQVTGGGRIDFDPIENRCVVYGFSYGFGKGNHEMAAKIVQEHIGIPATFNNDDSLY